MDAAQRDDLRDLLGFPRKPYSRAESEKLIATIRELRGAEPTLTPERGN